jgi:hypothetical protein
MGFFGAVQLLDYELVANQERFDAPCDFLHGPLPGRGALRLFQWDGLKWIDIAGYQQSARRCFVNYDDHDKVILGERYNTNTIHTSQEQSPPPTNWKRPVS